jgi:CMP-N-acetylneuraminic acid synthetase
MLKIIALICARGGSKGIKNKNLLKLNGHSLLAHSILTAKKIKLIKSIYVSTDSKKIANEAKKYGAAVPFLRPKIFANDSSPEIYAWRHAVTFLKNNINLSPDYIVSIPTTSPLRKPIDIINAINKAKITNADIVFAITPSSKNPYFNMVINKNKLSIICKKKLYHNRQKAPTCFDITTVCYVFKPNYIMENLDLFSGKTSSVIIPKERSIDIDTKFDFKIATLLAKNNYNK